MQGECLYQSVLGGGGERPRGAPSSWEWRGRPEDGLYCALWPRAWTVYNIPEVGVRLICRQVSPCIPHNYKESSLPATVFIFNVENNSGAELKVAVTFCFKNGTGSRRDRSGGAWTEPFSWESVRGVAIHQEMAGLPVSYWLGARQGERSEVSWCSGWDPRGSGEQVWQPLLAGGQLESASPATQATRKGEEVACAVSVRGEVRSGQAEDLELCLCWDSPRVKFGGGLKEHRRFYTRYFRGAAAGRELCRHALESYQDWEREIETWQGPTLEDPDLPDWFKSAVFNELYYLSDGGSVWLEVEGLETEDLRLKYGRFGYLEAHEYTMYNTYDVHYYASWALVDLFPGLQLSLQLDFLDWVEREDKERVTELYGGATNWRKVGRSVPHDLGDPAEEPWVKVNSYNIHDVTEWRDLNLKLVITVWRDIQWLEEAEARTLLARALPVCERLMRSGLDWDLDRDGLIENGGKPDQTFDSWVMTGPSAYCGGLWLAALASIRDMSDMAGLSHGWTDLLAEAGQSYTNKLWNGKFFSFDLSPGGSRVIMADQLAGYWYRHLTGLRRGRPDQPLLEDTKVLSALTMIFSNNVMKFSAGDLGAVNGMKEGGEVERSAIQSEEVWTGVTYGLASLMISKGMVEEGMKTAQGIYKTVYETIGLGFETPEALYERKHYRAIGYMRPLSIWAMNIALSHKR